MLEVKSIKISTKELSVIPLGDRLYKLADYVTVRAETNQGTFVYKFKKDFVTNFRSGGIFVDRFVDQIGDSPEIQASWLIHDAAYTPCAACNGEHPISKQLADDLLYACLIYAGMGKAKALTVYYSVHWFGRSAYEDDDALTEQNSKLFGFEWSA